ncbi:ATP-binding protein [Streptomyces sp. E11-3]|uniref:ATP-binding protein n=1 Tax=Streptomyces sp. E11-3 TaxID=3110112 RepID=UPI00397F1418
MTPAAIVTTVPSGLVQQTAHDFSVAFTPAPARVAGMRRITRGHLRRWQVPDPLAEDIVLAVSELVTNAVRHAEEADEAVSLWVRCGRDELRIEVDDGNPAPAALRHAAAADVSGRGLLLVDILSHGWGVSDDGKTTWASFRLPARRP